jgi:hypothetical protein
VINLKKMYGSKYRITWDEARNSNKDKDPAYMQIPCRGKGKIIYAHSDTMLALEIDYHRGLAKRISSIPGVVLHQDGDYEKTFLFPPSVFDEIAKIVKPRTKKKMSPEHIAKLTKSLALHRFQNKESNSVSGG